MHFLSNSKQWINNQQQSLHFEDNVLVDSFAIDNLIFDYKHLIAKDCQVLKSCDLWYLPKEAEDSLIILCICVLIIEINIHYGVHCYPVSATLLFMVLVFRDVLLSDGRQTLFDRFKTFCRNRMHRLLILEPMMV